MPSSRKVVFANGEYYHVFNRGVEKRPTFISKYEFQRAVSTLNFYRFGDVRLRYSKYIALDTEKRTPFFANLNPAKMQVAIIAYCLMGNHFHILLQQLREHGIVSFMAKFTNSFTKYFNTKHERIGPLFQGVFKAVHVEDDEQLIHLSRYIHLNPVSGFKVKAEDLSSYQWSSYPEYIKNAQKSVIDNKDVINFFKSPDEYQEFVLNQADYSQQLKLIEHLTFD